MDNPDLIVDQFPPPLSDADINARLDEAEADEAEGRFIDTVALVRDLRRRADELKAKTDRRRA